MKQTNQKIWRISSVLTLILALFVSSTQAQAPLPTITNGTITAFPADYQLYPRIINPNDNSDDYALVTISGTIQSSSGFNRVRLKVLRDNISGYPYNYSLARTLPDVSLNYVSGTASFSFVDQLTAELNDYRYELYGVNSSNNETFLVARSNIVAGDAIIISGQSNAEAINRCEQPGAPYPCNPNSDDQDFVGNKYGNDPPITDRNFIRVYGNGRGSGWYTAQSLGEDYSLMPKSWGFGSGVVGRFDERANRNRHVGQVGAIFGRLLSTSEGIPICIFNGAYGAPILHFLKNSSRLDPTGRNNYNVLLSRIQEAGLQNNIRAIVWFQGESNMTDAENENLTTDQYKSQFNQLFDAWRLDYGSFEKLFVVQVKRGCFENNPDDALKIMQAQQEIVNERPGVAHLISSSNTSQIFESGISFCHYSWVGGYEEIGKRLFEQVRRYLYGGNINDANWQSLIADKAAPGPDPNQIQFSLKQTNDNITLSGSGIESDFRLEGGSYTITNVSINNALKRVVITYSKNSGTTQDPSSVSYFGHSGSAFPAITNSSGSGLAYFRSLPILNQPLPIDPLSLTVSRNGGAHQLRWKAESNERFDQFVVERGETRNSFKPVYEVYGTGQSGTIQYDFTDNKPNATVSHYRIRAIQQDGRELFSQVVTVNNRLNNVKEFRVYPNPVAGSANATINMNEAALATIHLHDASGRLLSSRKLQLQKGNNQFSLGELLDYNPGTYIVRVVTSTETQQIRVVKAK